MKFMFRAAAFAAASFVILSDAGYAGPSQAWELDPASIAFSTPPVVSEAAPLSESAPAIAVPAPAVPTAALSEAARPRTLNQLVADFAGARTSSPQHDCLARAVYFESKGEPLAGQLAVAEVILNRARSGRFASTVCGVVRQKGQFSFVRAGRIPSVAQGSGAWGRAVAVARVAMEDLAEGAAPKALFFHARRVSPGWKLKRVAAVGNHIFYR